MRPLLLLDVDGVLNPAPPPTGPLGAWTDWQPLSTHVEPAAWMPDTYVCSLEQGAAITALGCEVVWATTWEDDANDTYARAFGWSPRPVIPWLPAKAETVPAYLHERAAAGTLPASVVWVDDELRQGGQLAGDPQLGARLAPLPTAVLRMGPRTREGLTVSDVGETARWLAGRRR